MPVRVIALDVFGTIARIARRTSPYARVIRALGMADCAQAVRQIMSGPIDFGTLPGIDIAKLQADIEAEIASIEPYPDVMPALQELKRKGHRLAIISNLAAPYGPPLKDLFGGLIDEFIFSYETGHIKPDLEIFQILCSRFYCAPADVLMVGDSLKADIAGGQSFGMHTLHIDRNATKVDNNSISNLDALINHLTNEKGV